MSELTSSLQCKNCSSTVTGEYCAHCGQSRSTERITFRRIASELIEQVSNMDAGFLRTVRSLTLRPGHFCREYLLGQRQSFLKPLQFYLIMLALFFVFSELLKVDPMETGRQISAGMGSTVVSSAELQRQEEIQQILSNNNRVIFSVLVLLQAISLWLLYRRLRWYFIEWLVFSLFVIGYQYFFSLSMPVAVKLVGYHTVYSILLWVIMLLSVVYSSWAIKQFVQVDSKSGWGRAISAVLLTYGLFFILSALVGVIIGLLSASLQGK